MSPGLTDLTVLRRHMLALDEVLTQLDKHAGAPIDALRADLDERTSITCVIS